MSYVCQTYSMSSDNSFICDNVRIVDPSRYIPDQLLPLSVSVLIFNVSVLVLCCAFAVVYHHVRLAQWRMADLEMDRNEVINAEATDA